jgi:hypothetical protein
MCCTLDIVHKNFIVSSCSSRPFSVDSQLFSYCHSVRRIYCDVYHCYYFSCTHLYFILARREYLAKMFPRSVTTCWLSGDFYLYTHNNSYSHFYNCSRAPVCGRKKFAPAEWLMGRKRDRDSDANSPFCWGLASANIPGSPGRERVFLLSKGVGRGGGGRERERVAN